ncbi:hypothetical protein Poli38472_005842 [Pythium oligandrum]|uniref:Cytochrome b5 heme-binding domain-containing protein n=1 Tax=Pythium oligandrum TaxID=41045 RepID=A0A8K1CSE0_PYTOL|nr:hypothetical protein Poli38472_005842 [Pythium oligandrum]|eukprot:TMW68374.1 hypothetical protein Poli38472_005842 [Pythium oligandrum]
MPWVANNNQAGEIRAPAISAALRQKKQLEEQHAHERRAWSTALQSLALEESDEVDRVSARGCALLNPADFLSLTGESMATGMEFIHPRVHAQFVIPARAHPAVPQGCIALSQPQLINIEMCVGQTETWSLFQERVPTVNAMAVEIRPLVAPSSDAPVSVDAQEFGAAFVKFMWQCILTENERLTMQYKDGIEYFVRVLEIDAEDESETEFTMPDSFRGIVDEETQVFVSLDGQESEDAAFKLTNQVHRPEDKSLASMRSDVVSVVTNDEEEFPVKKKLLFPCIKLSSAVLSGKGVHKDASTTIEVDVDCLTFDRVLLYLEHEARNDDTEYQFDPQHAEELLTAANKLGCIGLQDVCKKRLGEFEARVRKEPIRWEEVQRRNNSGEIWLVMLGMVFDVTRWLPEHPGGSVIIPREAVNVDCTVMFEIYHSSRQSFRYLKQFYIGEIYEADLPLIPFSSSEKPSAGFVEELKEYTSWRITPSIPTFKSF